VAAADRADLMLWQSPAARLVKHRCLQHGVQLSHCSKVMFGLHPSQNLCGIAPESMFIFGERDPFIPARRCKGLLRAIRRYAPMARVVTIAAGHLGTMMASARYQRGMLGLADNAGLSVYQRALRALCGRVRGWGWPMIKTSEPPMRVAAPSVAKIPSAVGAK
jgi:hypothetical protein